MAQRWYSVFGGVAISHGHPLYNRCCLCNSNDPLGSQFAVDIKEACVCPASAALLL